MKKLNYAKYLISREWLPLFIVFTLIALVSYFSYLMSFNLYDHYSSDVSLAALTAPMMVFAIVLPLFVFNYKYSLKRGDTYYQLPLNQRDLKNTRVLAGLFILVTSFIIASLLPYIAFVIRYMSSPDHMRLYGQTYFKYFVPAPYLGAIAVGLITVVIEYFISCFFCSLTSKPISALIINVSFHLILVLSMYTFFNSIVDFQNAMESTYSSTYDYYQVAQVSFEYSPSVMILINLPDYIARAFSFDIKYELHGFDTDSFQRNVLITNIVLELVIGAAACFFTLFKKDDSGESCNNYGFANKKLNSLFFLSTIPVAFYALSTGYTFGFEDILGTVIVAAAYYFLFALFIGTFKMPNYAYAIICTMSGVVIFGDLFFAMATGNL